MTNALVRDVASSYVSVNSGISNQSNNNQPANRNLSTSGAKKGSPSVSPIHLIQFHILKTLSTGQATCGGRKQYQLSEIAKQTGVIDEKDLIRSLFILEGHKLVSPCPAGDFTSKIWHITEDGMKALNRFHEAVALL